MKRPDYNVSDNILKETSSVVIYFIDKQEAYIDYLEQRIKDLEEENKDWNDLDIERVRVIKRIDFTVNGMNSC